MRQSSRSSQPIDMQRAQVRRTALACVSGHARHNLDGHPECAGRLETIVSLLQDSGLASQCQEVPCRIATRQEIELVHMPSIWTSLHSKMQSGQLRWLDTDTYLTENSPQVALAAAGAALQATEEVTTGRADNGLALVRPPGHHATRSKSMGFCLLNNVAIAARWAQKRLGVERVLILDFDVHHGNGTQDIFYEDPNVLYISFHQYPLFPMTGTLAEIGSGPGLGTNCNLPVPAGTGDEGIRHLMLEIVSPLVQEFAPNLILVSAGFDGHWRDPLAQLELSLGGYAWLTQNLLALAEEVCKGKLVVFLEGGYDQQVLSCGVHNALQQLLGQKGTLDPIGASGKKGADISELLAKAALQWGLA